MSGRDQLLALIELHLHPPLLYKFMPLSFQRHCNGRLAPEQHLFSPPLVLTIKRGLWCSCIDMLTKRCINCQFWVLSSDEDKVEEDKNIPDVLTYWITFETLFLTAYNLLLMFNREMSMELPLWMDAGAGFGSWSKWYKCWWHPQLKSSLHLATYDNVHGMMAKVEWARRNASLGQDWERRWSVISIIMLSGSLHASWRRICFPVWFQTSRNKNIDK